MGAWGAGPFENDDALDWLAVLADSKGESALADAFAAVQSRDGDYLEAPEASIAIAAAEVVANALGAVGPSIPTEAEDWIRNNRQLINRTSR